MKLLKAAALAAGLSVVLSASALPQAATQTTTPAPANSVATSVDIPFTLEGAKIIVDVEMAPGKVLPFVFDSGLSNGNLVTPETAKNLGLKAGAKGSIRAAAGDRATAALTVVPNISIGAAKLSDQPFAITSIPEGVTERPGKPPLAGFIGAPLMKDAVLCIDYEHQVMRRWARSDFDDTRYSSIPMPQTRNLPTIVIKIDGREATMIVDSGNNGAVVVFAAFAMKNDFVQRYPDLASNGGFDGSGQQFSALAAEADNVEISPADGFGHVPLAVIPQGIDPTWGIDGMVGYEVLSKLNPCLDRDGERFLYQAE